MKKTTPSRKTVIPLNSPLSILHRNVHRTHSLRLRLPAAWIAWPPSGDRTRLRTRSPKSSASLHLRTLNRREGQKLLLRGKLLRWTCLSCIGILRNPQASLMKLELKIGPDPTSDAQVQTDSISSSSSEPPKVEPQKYYQPRKTYSYPVRAYSESYSSYPAGQQLAATRKQLAKDPRALGFGHGRSKKSCHPESCELLCAKQKLKPGH